jgi:L-fuconolactonase
VSDESTADFYSDPAPQGFGRIRPPDLEWLATAEPEDVIEPELAIVDAQQHLWDRPGGRYLLPEVAAEIEESGHRIVASVAVESNVMYRAEGPVSLAPLGEVEFLNGMAAMSASGEYGPARIGAAILAFADLALGDWVEDLLDAEQQTSGRLRGIRYPTMWDGDPTIRSPKPTRPEMLRDDAVLRGARALLDRGLSLDTSVFFTQLSDVGYVANQLPQLPIVLGHLGLPLGYGAYAGRKDEVHSVWRAGMAELARYPNVRVKLGGMLLRFAAYDYNSDRRPAGSLELAGLWSPYFTEAIELFGADRCMFESNFPADKVGVTYRIIWNTFKRIATHASESEKAHLFADTACRLYGIGSDDER